MKLTQQLNVIADRIESTLSDAGIKVKVTGGVIKRNGEAELLVTTEAETSLEAVLAKERLIVTIVNLPGTRLWRDRAGVKIGVRPRCKPPAKWPQGLTPGDVDVVVADIRAALSRHGVVVKHIHTHLTVEWIMLFFKPAHGTDRADVLARLDILESASGTLWAATQILTHEELLASATHTGPDGKPGTAAMLGGDVIGLKLPRQTFPLLVRYFGLGTLIGISAVAVAQLVSLPWLWIPLMLVGSIGLMPRYPRASRKLLPRLDDYQSGATDLTELWREHTGYIVALTRLAVRQSSAPGIGELLTLLGLTTQQLRDWLEARDPRLWLIHQLAVWASPEIYTYLDLPWPDPYDFHCMARVCTGTFSPSSDDDLADLADLAADWYSELLPVERTHLTRYLCQSYAHWRKTKVYPLTATTAAFARYLHISPIELHAYMSGWAEPLEIHLHLLAGRLGPEAYDYASRPRIRRGGRLALACLNFNPRLGSQLLPIDDPGRLEVRRARRDGDFLATVSQMDDESVAAVARLISAAKLEDGTADLRNVILDDLESADVSIVQFAAQAGLPLDVVEKVLSVPMAPLTADDIFTLSTVYGYHAYAGAGFTPPPRWRWWSRRWRQRRSYTR